MRQSGCQSVNLDQLKRSDRKILWSTQLLIDGDFVQGHGAPLEIRNPATEETLSIVQAASRAQVDAAVGAARRAFVSPRWADGELRRRVLLRLADLLEEHQREMAAALIEELGTPINLIAPLQLGVPLSVFRYYAQAAAVDRTRYLGIDRASAAPSDSMVRYAPVGVIGAITAYNYPLLMLAVKVGPAIAAGCTAVVLPSIRTPLSTLLFGRLLTEAGVPDGVINIIVGGADIGQALSEHPGVDKVSFTGSVPVGRAVMQQAAKTIKGVVLELGGKSASIILPGADLAKTIAPIHLRYLRNAGQGCASPTRLLVHESMLEEFLALSRGFYPSVRVGDPWDAATAAGPLISEAHRARVEGYVERALASGGRIAAGGGRPALDKGWFMNPTLIVDVENSHEICREELFGPVAIALPYRDTGHAIDIANDSALGLAAAIFGPTAQAKEIAAHLRVGSVYINGGGSLRVDAPMGGFKQSGLGREYGQEGLSEYLEPQHIQWSVA
jgi:aldehyde dehydrogenase (NAD+)